MLAIMPPS